MDIQGMTFKEIKENREGFLSNYNVSAIFPDCGVSWGTLMEIGEDYESKCIPDGEYYKIIQEYIARISSFENVHSYRHRIKKTGSLLSKIILKSNKRQTEITVNNYFREITDLLGIRILYIFKEEYWPIHRQIMNEYGNYLVENVHLKLRNGDDKESYRMLLDSCDVMVEERETYRSIHYTLNAKPGNPATSPKLEIQTRTIFEEGWSEINHKLVYKKEHVPGLQKASNILSELVGSCNSIGSLMKYLYDEGLQPSRNANPSATSAHTQKQDIPEDDKVGNAIRRFLLQSM